MHLTQQQPKPSCVCFCTVTVPTSFLVPTNYRIKNRNATGSKDDEDKNLGRWVNRQRSLYQAGKLRKDRQQVRFCITITLLDKDGFYNPLTVFCDNFLLWYLKKNLQYSKALEKVGLKWSMLATTSWESMFETLCEYIDVKVRTTILLQ